MLCDAMLKLSQILCSFITSVHILLSHYLEMGMMSVFRTLLELKLSHQELFS